MKLEPDEQWNDRDQLDFWQKEDHSKTVWFWLAVTSIAFGIGVVFYCFT